MLADKEALTQDNAKLVKEQADNNAIFARRLAAVKERAEVDLRKAKDGWAVRCCCPAVRLWFPVIVRR